MGTISSKVNTKMGEKKFQVSQDCLGVPTILRRVLEHLSNRELIELSLVNKLWNFEARSVMKERGTIRANASPDEYNDKDDPCQKLVAFASDLEKMRVVPFSGIYVHLHHRSACRGISNGSLAPSYDVILNRLRWKYFAVRFCDEWQECENCPALILVKKILADFCGVLEELSLHCGEDEIYENIFQELRFPCLKTLKVEPGDFDTTGEPLTGAFMKALVSRAPHLQELHTDGEIDFEANILEGSSAVLVPTRPFCPLFEQACEGLISLLRVTAMEIFVEKGDADPELLSRFIPMVLVASRTTLQTLDVDLFYFIRLLCYGICLENVTTLQIHMNRITPDGTEATAGLEIPDGLNFPRVFPKLSNGTVFDYSNQGYNYVLLKYTPSLVP